VTVGVRGYLKNRVRHEVLRLRALYRHRSTDYSPKLPGRRVRAILKKHELGFYPDGNATWWYASFDQRGNEEDELTKAALRFVNTSFPKDARILITGCGTGWMLVWFGQHGFRNLDGFDYLDNVVAAAKDIAALANVKAKLWHDDGFAPTLVGDYDLILVLHWLFSAWMGNYGNEPRAKEDRESLLEGFLVQYMAHLKPGGLVMVKLIDSISDHLEPPTDISPIRHSFDQVERVAQKVGLRVENRMFNQRYGHLPRMLYFLRKA
jgi:SAM-dependent methyltransferase